MHIHRTSHFISIVSLSALACFAGMACGAGQGETGGGGTGGDTPATTTSSGGATTSASSSSTGGQGGDPTTCGDGVRQGAEGCDGEDLGGATCLSLGLGPGTLRCAEGCGLVTSACAAAEICSDHLDNNLDGLIDCGDPACAPKPECASGCGQVQPVLTSNQGVGDYEFHGSTVGKPNGVTPSCAPASGSEQIISFIPPAAGRYTVTIGHWGNASEFSLSIRTDCASASSEVACLDRPSVFGNYNTEYLVLDVQASTTYYLIVDSRAGSPSGLFSIWVSPVLPENTVAEADACTGGFDEDFNGLTDCNDPACAADAGCVPGAAPFGAPCELNSDCAAADGKPLCTTTMIFPASGLCSKFCSVQAQDCGPGNVCIPTGTGEGFCLDGCTTVADCQPGYECRDMHLSTKACAKMETDCAMDSYDDDGDGLEDCLDPDCAGSPECVVGTKVAGSACTAHTECSATGGDPFCLNGNCTEGCDPTDPNACGADALCIGHTFLGFLCYHKCDESADCPDPSDGYCVDLPSGYGYAGVCNLSG